MTGESTSFTLVERGLRFESFAEEARLLWHDWLAWRSIDRRELLLLTRLLLLLDKPIQEKRQVSV